MLSQLFSPKYQPRKRRILTVLVIATNVVLKTSFTVLVIVTSCVFKMSLTVQVLSLIHI